MVQLYETKRFTSGGFRHYELYFPDGSCPTEAIVDRFLTIAENEGTVLLLVDVVMLSAVVASNLDNVRPRLAQMLVEKTGLSQIF